MTPDAGSDLKPYVRLYDGAGVGLAGASAYSGPAEFTYNDVVAGTTYIIGAGGNWFTKGGFDLDVQFALYDVPVTVPPMEYYGPVNIDGDRQFTMALNTVSDRDTWLFTTENGGAATFTATATSGGINPLLALYDGAGDLVAVAETSTGATEMLNYTLNQRELYTILVMDAERDNTGNVDVAIDSPAVTTVPTITLGADGAGSGSEYLGYGNDPARADPDYFQFTAPADASGRLSITVTPDQAFRLEFQLFDSAGAPVGGRYASPSDGAAATHTYTGLTPGETYHMCVFAYQFGDHPAGGDFEVAVDFDLRPTVGALDYELKPTIIGEDITLTAIGVADGDGNLQRVEFYRDENDNGTLEIGTDSYLGSDYSAIGGWQRVASTAGMDSGWTWFFTRARDTYGNLSDVARRLACVTYMGDANCDGKVGIADLGALADNYGKTSGATWRDGDFNRDGKVGIADLGALADNYGMGAGGQAAATGGSETAGAAEAEVPPAGSSGSSAAVVPEVSGAELSLPVVQLDVEAAPVGGGDGLTEPPSLTVTVVGDSSSDDQAQEGAVELLDAPSLTVLP
ncbi:MAG: hypothetical protein B1H04_00490 [Planctomycetales bacterium 4484_123]|nr:MAG: hypothetical protein B1H04_00490 [Planctomycetales bacterium 4484_123]